MSRIELAPEVLDDLDRFVDHLLERSASDAPERIGAIVDALQVLSSSPRIGRPVRSGMRELVIGQGARGYIALYRYVDSIDTVFVLAIRHQREAGFPR